VGGIVPNHSHKIQKENIKTKHKKSSGSSTMALIHSHFDFILPRT
jgi:hypothetical protein